MSNPTGFTPSLNSRRLSERAEAVRELGRSGQAPDLGRLFEMALADASSGVRLAAAAAMADILARYRTPDVFGDVPVQVRSGILERLTVQDPGRNTGLFQVIAELGLPGRVRHLVRGLRDPRVDVRTGALVGLERLCLSPVESSVGEIEQALVGLLDDSRLRPEIALEVARLAARVGIGSVAPAMERLQERVADKWFDPLQEAIDQLEQDERWWHLMPTWIEASTLETRGARWLVVLPDAWLWGAEDDLRWQPARLVADGRWRVGPVGSEQSLPCRMLRPSKSRQPADLLLHVGQSVFRPMREADVQGLLHGLVDRGVVPEGRRQDVNACLGALLSEGGVGCYVRGLQALWLGSHDLAAQRLGELDVAGELPAERYWYLGCACERLGRWGDARVAVRRYLEVAGGGGARLERARQWMRRQEPEE